VAVAVGFLKLLELGHWLMLERFPWSMLGLVWSK
jgi:hypothetical protein